MIRNHWWGFRWILFCRHLGLWKEVIVRDSVNCQPMSPRCYYIAFRCFRPWRTIHRAPVCLFARRAAKLLCALLNKGSNTWGKTIQRYKQTRGKKLSNPRVGAGEDQASAATQEKKKPNNKAVVSRTQDVGRPYAVGLASGHIETTQRG